MYQYLATSSFSHSFSPMDRASSPSLASPSSNMSRRWARRFERYCCSCLTYFPLVFIYGITTWAVWVVVSIGSFPTPEEAKASWVGKPPCPSHVHFPFRPIRAQREFKLTGVMGGMNRYRILYRRTHLVRDAQLVLHESRLHRSRQHDKQHGIFDVAHCRSAQRIFLHC